METVLHEACDNCHRRKTRCPSDGGGPCTNCRASGQVCIFSPRSRIGRPRVRPSRSKRNRTRTPSLTQIGGDNNAGSHIPTVFDSVPGYTTPVPSIVLGGADGGNADETTLASDPSYMHSLRESVLEPFLMSLTEPLIPFDNEFPFFSPEEVGSLCKSPSQITENEISQRDLAFLSPNKSLSVHRTTTSPALVPEQQPQQSYMEDRSEYKGKSLIAIYGQLSQLFFTLHLTHDTFYHRNARHQRPRLNRTDLLHGFIPLRCRELALAIGTQCIRLYLIVISLSSSVHLDDQHSGGDLPASFGRQSPSVNGAHADPFLFATISPDLHHTLIIAILGEAAR